jgi:uncharacterized membrane protein YhaH (DUF805 family)
MAAWAVFLAVRESLGLDRAPGLAAAWASLQIVLLAGLSVARLHDRNRSAWALSAALLPVLGALWLFFELACSRGSRGANRFGKEPGVE